MKYRIGEVRESNNFGKYKIINYEFKKGYTVKFLETGYIVKNLKTNRIYKNTIKDYFKPIVCGVGYMEEPKLRTEFSQEYSIWRGMLRRCYDKNSNRYNSYGDKGVKVCKRWHSFKKFLNDIDKIDGYDKEKLKNGEISLDKDMRNNFDSSKIYSLQTCKFISKAKNSKYQPNHQKYFKAISPKGKVYYHFNMTEFSKNFNKLRSSYISRVINGNRKSALGWKFEEIEQMPKELTLDNINKQFE